MLRFSTIQNVEVNLEPSLNGGLYTGEQFKGPWGNVSVIPDVVPMTTETLSNGNTPPDAALSQFGNIHRPGNNRLSLYKNSINRFSDRHTIMCTKSTRSSNNKVKKCKSFDTWTPQHETL